jgi:hypothetical protein
MTSQSPRIYIYKITFEEVPYYYYGVHKEAVFDEEYWGTPITHKWCWNFYTPKKQILEIFPFTDEGWLEAQEVETRLIRPFYNADKWCLNESCGGKFSLQVLSKAGKIGGKITGKLHKENGTGICGISKEERIRNGIKHGKKGGDSNKENKTGICSLTTEQLSENGKKGGNKSKELGVGIFALTPEQQMQNRIDGGKIGGNKAKEFGVGVHGFTTEQRRLVVKKTNSQKWMCLETGYITTSGPLTAYQRKRGIDPSNRRRIK